MFDVFYIGRKPGLFAHERAADSVQHAQSQSRTRYCWIVTYLADYSAWDWLWEPPPWQQDFVHVWPSQWHDFSGTYLVPRLVDQIQYHFHERVLYNRSRPDEFELLAPDVEFDFTWAPHPLDPPFVHVFGNQWWPANKWPTVRYRVPGAQCEKFNDKVQARLSATNDHWEVLHECDFDRSWRPDPGDPPYVYVFGNQWWPPEKMPTMQYRLPGAVDRKFVHHPRALLPAKTSGWQIPDDFDVHSMDLSWVPDPGAPPYIYQFGTQHQKTGGPRYVVPGATEISYVNSPRFNKTTVDPHWEVPTDAVYSEDFDWTWHPDATELPYVYQFGTQHQKTGGPRYVVPGASEVKYTDQLKLTVQSSQAPVVVIDHLDGNAKILRDSLASHIEVVKIGRYVDNYLDTLKRIAASLPDHVEHIWIVSSICDYANFDFTWYPEQWQATMLHVFASDDQKFGDTFFMHVPTFRMRSASCQLLDWYDVNYLPNRSVPRIPLPIIRHTDDSHVDQILRSSWCGPLALFTTLHDTPKTVPAVPLWRQETKTVTPLDAGAASVIVPRSAVPYISTQVYDYAHIDNSLRGSWSCEPLDIVFISNGEVNADQNWATLLLSKQGRPNRCVRVDGVNGRAAAYHAAAAASETAWFFAVFAKLEVVNNFDWSWQPDRLQQPKHYIFHALNPVNQLEYGHQAMIAYNRQLTLANPGRGLDFTLDDAHEVVPILSGVARYNVDAWTAWRTAFREVIKLRASLPDVESEYRIRQWVSVGNGPYGQHSQDGAQDALDYYDEVNGDFVELRKSYEWAWLASYALMRRNLVPGQ